MGLAEQRPSAAFGTPLIARFMMTTLL